MMFKSLLATVAVFVASVAAQTAPVSITQPLTGFTVTAGQPYVISWVSPNTDTLSQIWLAQGNTTSLAKIELIAQNVPTAPLTYTWNVDAGIAPGQYSLELGIAPNIAYAGPFNIVAGTGAAPASSAAASSAASNSSATDSSSASSAAATSAPSSSAAATSAAAAPSSSPSAAASAAASPASNSSTPATTTAAAKSDAKMIAPVALLAIVPIVLAVL